MPKTTTPSRAKKSLPTSPFRLTRLYTKAGVHPFDTVSWVRRDAVLGSGEKKAFEQRDVEFPEFWSANAVNITASKYFRGKLGTPEREWSVKQMIGRVAKTIRGWGEEHGYFTTAGQAQIFEDELTHMLLYQKGAFNSPVWFNVGTTPHPQCSACFILSVEDSMRSILDWISTEGMIFKGGSGAGVNLSFLRAKTESLSAGGKASGPVSFMRGADSVAGMIKSGGTTRRAAKMVILNIDHPDVMEFIRCKAEEEKKVRALSAMGYNMADLNNDAWNSIQFQNANNSVRITDDFMHAVQTDGDWTTRYVTSGKPAETMKARAVLAEIAQAAWECGDPGVQFDTIINDWHTCPNSGRINGSNPCSEYMHIDNSACNLASINLMQYLREDGTFMAREFAHTVDIFTTAMDIIVAGSSYPTEQIGKNARDFRQLGLGFANLGALLMTKGIAYDSAEGAAWAGSIAALMTGEAYRWSSIIASHVGPFAGYAVNREPMLRVIEKHLAAAKVLPVKQVDDKQLVTAAKEAWMEALKAGRKWGYRNSQASVIAPTGTISFMMDCDTTGIEPDFSLVKMKQLVGGGWMKIVNGSVTRALRNLGYTASEAKDIVDYITDAGAIEGAPHLRPEHLSVFDTAVKPMNGTRSISWRGHIRIVAAVQPFISGAISKTFNMPAETTKEEISEAYVMAWKMGIKAFAVYRDGSKGTQPLNTEMKKKDDSATETAAPREAVRQKLPDVRRSETHKFVVAGHQGYLTYSAYDDGRLAEMFVRMAKQGSTLSGLLDALALATSINLQYGVPLKVLAAKFIYTRFEPAGFTENPEIQIATSILDYIFRYLSLRFLPDTDLAELGMSRVEPLLVESGGAIEAMPVSTHTSIPTPAPVPATVSAEVSPHAQTPKPNGNGNKVVFSDSVCRKCGGMMVRTGTCNTCLQCGTSSGGCS